MKGERNLGSHAFSQNDIKVLLNKSPGMIKGSSNILTLGLPYHVLDPKCKKEKGKSHAYKEYALWSSQLFFFNLLLFHIPSIASFLKKKKTKEKKRKERRES